MTEHARVSSRCQPHRMRRTEALRSLIRETRLSTDQLVMPVFVRSGTRIRSPIPSMPGQFQLSVDQAAAACEELAELRVKAVLLFGVSAKKEALARGAYAKAGVVQQAVRAIKARLPHLLVITDVCLCAYTSHGHCGVVEHAREFSIDHDATLALLAKTAVSHAEAGADLVAPSDMMDGNVGAIRQALDRAGFSHLPIMAYTAKYASSFYGPFREAVDSAPRFGDRRSYQMDPANADEALREARLDIEQGADILMVKPALAYLDIIHRLKRELGYPLAAFNVSGEYAMVKAAASRGWLDERPAWMEMLVSLKRAGADLLITYWAKDAARLLGER